MSVQSGQDNYNRNTRPAKLAEKHENTIKQIKSSLLIPTNFVFTLLL